MIILHKCQWLKESFKKYQEGRFKENHKENFKQQWSFGENCKNEAAFELKNRGKQLEL